MKNLLDRHYGLNKFYGSATGSLWAGKKVAILATHGYERDYATSPSQWASSGCARTRICSIWGCIPSTTRGAWRPLRQRRRSRAPSGCAVYAPFGLGSWITGERYADAEAYEAGAFNYAADAVTRVEIYWRCGQIEVIESDGDELSVRESSVLPEKAALHHLLEDGTLRIRFCASGVNIQVRSADKHLTVEVPRGIDLVIHTTSGAVRIDALEAETAELHTSSGAVALNLTAPMQLNVRTSSGGVTLTLPEGGAEVAYTASSGRLHTDREYVSRGDLCVFGAGESKITVRCSSGGLRIR